MSVDITRKMKAKDRRIWRRRMDRRNGHSIRCYQFKGKSCSCKSGTLREWGNRQRADRIEA